MFVPHTSYREDVPLHEEVLTFSRSIFTVRAVLGMHSAAIVHSLRQPTSRTHFNRCDPRVERTPFMHSNRTCARDSRLDFLPDRLVWPRRPHQYSARVITRPVGELLSPCSHVLNRAKAVSGLAALVGLSLWTPCRVGRCKRHVLIFVDQFDDIIEVSDA